MPKPFTLQKADGYRNVHFLYHENVVLGEMLDFSTMVRNKVVQSLNARKPALDALELAEGFMSGFEDDEAQEGMTEKLTAIRAAIKSLKGGL